MIVLSAVGSVTARVVSKESAVEPSNIISLIFGLVKVLFVSVSDPVNETKLSPCNPALNSPRVPVNVPKSSRSMCNVLALLLIVLFVNVSVVALPTSVSLALDGSVSVISLDGLPGVKVVSKLSSVEPSKTREPVMVPDNAIVSVAALPSVIVLPCVDDVPTTVKLPSTCTFAPDIVRAALELELDLITSCPLELLNRPNSVPSSFKIISCSPASNIMSVAASNVILLLLSISAITGVVKVLFVSVSVVSCPTKVVVAFGNDTVLSAVGSTVVKVVSKLSALDPSNTKAFCTSIVELSTVVVEPCTVRLPATVIRLF